MRLSIKEGKTLLVDGPASVNLLKGSVTVLGAIIGADSKIVVRNGKRLPFEAVKDAEFELTLGEASSFQEIDGSAIPNSWKNAADTLLASKGSASVLIIGCVDSGKTGFCTYLANEALKKRRKVAIIDADLGQSDLGPPTTVGLARIAEPAADLFGIQTESIVFVGATTPSKAFNASLNAVKALEKEIFEKSIDFLIVNTDGWVIGEEATNHKNQLIELLTPSGIVAIQEGDELESLLETLKDLRTFLVESPKNVRKRSHEMRKALRELAYRKYLKGAKIQSYPLSWVKIRGAPIETINPLGSEQRSMDGSSLQATPVYYEEPATLLSGEDLRNLLVGLEDEKDEFLGIGILCSIDLERRTMKVYTPVTQPTPTIHIGRVRLDKSGKEIV